LKAEQRKSEKHVVQPTAAAVAVGIFVSLFCGCDV
jgi:hypothetical protein